MWQLDGGLIAVGHQPSPLAIPKNHTSPTQIIRVPGVVRRGRPRVVVFVRTMGVGVEMYGHMGVA